MLEYLLLAWGNRGILSDDFLPFRMLVCGNVLYNSKVLSDLHCELGARPWQIVDVAVMIDGFFGSDYEFGSDGGGSGGGTRSIGESLG